MPGLILNMASSSCIPQVARVAHYIRAKTRRSQTDPDAQPFQSIVISLKDIFYEKADALVGVARDGEMACSRTFTFDLSRFEAPSLEEGA
jgi:structural maintenance of chromosome 1